jgi:hypothetical protein
MFINHGKAINELIKVANEFGNPELINDGENTAPSKRIIRLIPDYQKVTAGYQIAEKIGLAILREKCRHFSEWLIQLERAGWQV